MNDIRKIKNFLLDMDGTIYLGNQLFPGTIPLLTRIAEKGGRAIFLTNNSSASPAAYVQKLARLGVTVTEDDIFTSGDAAVFTLLKIFGAPPKVYLLGTPELQEQLETAGFAIVNGTAETPDCVLLGFDKTLTYQKLVDACNWITAGVPYYATHPDFTCPVENGFIPDTGSMICLIEATTGKRPIIFGKPEKTMADAAMARYGFEAATTAMVGDRLMTDIRFGNNAGMASVLVLSGETTLEDYEKQTEAHADFIYPSVTELCAEL